MVANVSSQVHILDTAVADEVVAAVVEEEEGMGIADEAVVEAVGAAGLVVAGAEEEEKWLWRPALLIPGQTFGPVALIRIWATSCAQSMARTTVWPATPTLGHEY